MFITALEKLALVPRCVPFACVKLPKPILHFRIPPFSLSCCANPLVRVTSLSALIKVTHWQVTELTAESRLYLTNKKHLQLGKHGEACSMPSLGGSAGINDHQSVQVLQQKCAFNSHSCSLNSSVLGNLPNRKRMY